MTIQAEKEEGDEEEKKEEERKEEERKDPAFVPRRDTFWSHDDRWDDSQQEQDRFVIS